MDRELLHKGGIAIGCLKAGSLRVLHPLESDLWNWQAEGMREETPAPSERFPFLVLLAASKPTEEPALWQAGARRWPLRPARLIELEGVVDDPGSIVKLLEQQPILYDLLPARLLLPNKLDADPLFAGEVNALARMSRLGGRMQDLAELTVVRPAGRNTPPTWQYRSWRSGAKVEVALDEETRPSLWSYLDPIVLKIEGKMGTTPWKARLEQFRAFG